MARDSRQGAFGLPLSVLMALMVAMAVPAHGHGPEDFEDVPEGMVQARITEAPDVTGLQLMLLEGERQGILVHYRGDETLTFFGEAGKPLLRFTGQGVEANRNSETWQTLDESEKQQASGDETDWVTVASTGRYAWIDPRLSQDGAPEDQGEAQTLGDWHIHMERSGEESCQGISGVRYWYPLDTGHEHARHDSAMEATSPHNH